MMLLLGLNPGSWTFPWPMLVVLPVMIYMAIRQLRGHGQRVRPGRIWIMPAVIVLLTVWVLWHSFSGGSLWYLAAGFALGLGMGIARNAALRMQPGEHPGEMQVRARPWGLAVWVAFLIVRLTLRFALAESALPVLLANGFLTLPAGMMLARAGTLQYKLSQARRTGLAGGPLPDANGPRPGGALAQPPFPLQARLRGKAGLGRGRNP
jgi:hypothetical protein